MTEVPQARVVTEGWLWKKKGSTAGALFKSVRRRYCVLDESGTFACYDDQDGELLTRVKIFEAKKTGKWFYIRGYNDIKSTNCYLKFQGDFENDTADWSERVTGVVDAVSGGRNRGETQGLFFEGGDKRASAYIKGSGDDGNKKTDSFGRIIDGEEEDGEDEENKSELTNFLNDNNSDGGDETESTVAADVKVSETKEKEEAKEEDANGKPLESEADGCAQDEVEKPSTVPEKETTGSPAPEGAKEDEEEPKGTEVEGDDSSKSSKGASLWGKLAAGSTGGATNSPSADPVSAPSGDETRKRNARELWQSAGATNKKKGGKKLYGADLLKHMSMQQVHDMRVSKEAAEMERWKAQCEMGDEMNPSKSDIQCFICDEKITSAYMELNNKKYHKDCFSCIVCQANVKGGAYEINGALYCEKHRVEALPKCFRCKGDIHGKYIIGPGRELYHNDCFSCKGCDRKIRTYCEHENEIYCVTCYSNKYASRCATCKEKLKDRIRTLQGTEEAAGLKWHESCFRCSKCSKHLHQKVFFQDKKLFCEYCMKKSHLPSCKKCRMPVEGACVNALDASWHPKCFVCTKCESPLKGFISEKGKPYCKVCYEDLHAQVCDSCGKAVKGAFINALGKTFHDTCFVCCNCEKKIDGSFMKSPDDLPCCLKDCLSEYYKNVILPRKQAQAERG